MKGQPNPALPDREEAFSTQSLKRENRLLKSALKEYRSMLDKYRILTESSLAGIYVIQKGQFQYVNPSLAEMLGYREEDLIGHDFWDLVYPKDRLQIRSQVQRRQQAITYPLRFTFRVVKKDGSIAWVDVRGMIARYLGRRAHIGTVVDITERKRTEEALKRERSELEKRVQERTDDLVRANEQLQREVEERKLAEKKSQAEKNFSDSVINRLPGIFYLIDESGRMIRWNRNIEDTSGYTSEELRNMNAMDFLQKGDRDRVWAKIQETISALGEPTLAAKPGIEATLAGKSGIMAPYLMTGVRLELEGKAYQVGVGMDISERKKAERAILESKQELRDLSAKLISAQEKERQRLAMELHDGIGQALSAINFSLEKMMKRLERDDDARNQRSLGKVLPMVKDTIEDVRRMSRNLRPSILDDLGILTTINWFCRNFGQVYPNIVVQKRMALIEKEIPEPLKIVIFRILQEAMNNAAKHSRAGQIEIVLCRKDGAIEFKIKDDGQGFDQKKFGKIDSAQKGFGIASMKDRIELSGGIFRLKTAPGKGTAVSARWPEEDALIR